MRCADDRPPAAKRSTTHMSASDLNREQKRSVASASGADGSRVDINSANRWDVTSCKATLIEEVRHILAPLPHAYQFDATCPG